MGDKSNIEWTDATWNPVTGCDKISAGCANCYAEALAPRLQKMGAKGYENGFKVTLHPERLNQPLLWKKPRIIFVNSMSDLFHKDVPTSFIQEVFEVMGKASHHDFQILTKRPERMVQMDKEGLLNWRPNIWMGVSVEDSRVVERAYQLIKCGAFLKFLSVEPLIGPLSIGPALDEIDWVIVGGESGLNARPMQPDWVRVLQQECSLKNVPFFFKQWGGKNKKAAGRELDGRTYDDMPEAQR